MPEIDSTSRFLVQMREQVSAVARQARSGTPSAKGPKISKGDPARDVQQLILQRVLAIDPDDPNRRRKAFRVFLESVLADELGSHLLNDPEYHQIVDKVHRTMEGNAGLAGAIEKAGEFLLKNAQKR
jgi:hypothetical protein